MKENGGEFIKNKTILYHSVSIICFSFIWVYLDLFILFEKVGETR